jgi:hypothetical protein
LILCSAAAVAIWSHRGRPSTQAVQAGDVPTSPAPDARLAAPASPAPAATPGEAVLPAASSPTLTAEARETLELKNRIRRASADLIRVRVLATNGDPNLKAQSQELALGQAALQEKIAAHPEALKIVEQQKADAAELKRLGGLRAALMAHVEFHGKPGDPQDGGTAGSVPAPFPGCEYCAQDFNKLVAGDKDVLDRYSRQIADWSGQEQALLGKKLRAADERKALEKRLAATDPELSRAAGELRTKKMAFSAKVDSAPAVAALQADIVKLKKSFQERQAELVKRDIAKNQTGSGPK